jgi:2-oxo-3-hexenedioate decarboxylase
MNPAEHSKQLLAAYDQARRIGLPTSLDSGFDLARGYEVASAIRALRSARGERQTGYKIGFTNRTIWPRYGVFGPIWGPVWNTTTTLLDAAQAEVSLNGLVQPRLEPEIAFGFAKAPRAGMSEAELAGCIDWVAHSFEIVHTHFDDWRFQAADTVADFALHGRLIVGPRMALSRFATPGADLAALRVQLHRDGQVVDEGRGSNVLDGPLSALRIWVDAMLAQPHGWRIEAGHVVTTGTITDAAPLLPGQRWTTVLSDSRLTGLALTARA